MTDASSEDEDAPPEEELQDTGRFSRFLRFRLFQMKRLIGNRFETDKR